MLLLPGSRAAANARHAALCYSVTSNAPSVSEVCDYDGSKLVVRENDRPEVVGERFRAYERQTEPVLEFLKGAGYAFYEVEGADASPQAIARRIENWVVGQTKRMEGVPAEGR